MNESVSHIATMRPEALLLCLLIVPCYHQSLSLRERGCPAKPPTWEQKLRDHLMLCGSRSYAPRGQRKVELSLDLLNFKYLSSKQVLVVVTRSVVQWTDVRLQWDPAQFNGITRTMIHSFDIWTPSIGSHDDDTWSAYLFCHVFSFGEVLCTSEMFFFAYCVVDLSAWPRDIHTCSLQLGVWNIEKGRSKTLLNLGRPSIHQRFPANFPEWNLTGYEVKMNQSAERQVDLLFTFKRSAATLEVTVIHLSVVLSVLTLLPLVLDPRRSLRVCSAAFCLMCHFYFLPDLANEVPPHSSSAPLILFYFRGSIFISTMSVALSIAAKALCARDGPLPELISTKVDYIFKSYGKFVGFLRWRVESVAESKHKNDWTDFVNVVNSMFVCVCVAAYAILYCVFVPSEAPCA